MNEPRFMRIAGIAGIVGVLLLLIANLQLGSTPKAEDPLLKVASFLTDNRGPALVFVLLFGLGYILLLTFTVGVWELLRRAGDGSGLPALVFAAGLWVIVVGSAALVAVGAAAFRAPAIAPGTARSLLDVSNIAFALIGFPFALLYGAASLSAMLTRALPRWIVWVGALVVVLNLVKVFSVFPRSGSFAPGGGLSLVAVVPIWVWTIAVGVVMIRGTRRPSAPPPPR